MIRQEWGRYLQDDFGRIMKICTLLPTIMEADDRRASGVVGGGNGFVMASALTSPLRSKALRPPLERI